MRKQYLIAFCADTVTILFLLLPISIYTFALDVCQTVQTFRVRLGFENQTQVVNSQIEFESSHTKSSLKSCKHSEP